MICDFRSDPLTRGEDYQLIITNFKLSFCFIIIFWSRTEVRALQIVEFMEKS